MTTVRALTMHGGGSDVVGGEVLDGSYIKVRSMIALCLQQLAFSDTIIFSLQELTPCSRGMR